MNRSIIKFLIPIALFCLPYFAQAAPGLSLFEITATPQNLTKVIAAIDKWMASPTGKKYKGRLLLQENLADGANPATNSIVDIFHSMADFEAFGKLAANDPAWAEFLNNICPTTQTAAMYFSGIDLDYNTYSASLTNWAGSEVKIRFHLSGDLYWPGGNWWIDDVQVTHAETGGTCSTLDAGPPPIPDGASVPGVPVRATRSGDDVTLTWDTSSCPATAVNVYRGALGNFSTFTGGACNLPGAAGAATVSAPGDSWFLVAATDGASTDGSWSRDHAGAELSYTGASAVCPSITQHVTNHSCP